MNPTLWRTCRVLSGETRVALLRWIVNQPDLTVSDLAEKTSISRSRASQELRRLQSRGLVQAHRDKAVVRYRPRPDPQVPSAKPLLSALQEVLQNTPVAFDSNILRIGSAFSNTRRLAILRVLMKQPCDFDALRQKTHFSTASLQRHLRTLRLCGMVKRTQRTYELTPASHPLAQCLLRLLSESPASA